MGVQVVDMHTVLDRVIPRNRPWRRRSFRPLRATGQPNSETVGIVIPAVALVSEGGAAELASPDDERLR